MKTVIAVVLILIGCFLLFNQYQGFDFKKSEKVIDSLNVEIKIKEDSILVFQKEICIFVDKVEVAEKKLEENKIKIKKIYEIYEVQIQTIDSYDVNQLEQFFSDRYKNKTSTK
jgi:thioredoxin-related protein